MHQLMLAPSFGVESNATKSVQIRAENSRLGDESGEIRTPLRPLARHSRFPEENFPSVRSSSDSLFPVFGLWAFQFRLSSPGRVQSKAVLPPTFPSRGDAERGLLPD